MRPTFSIITCTWNSAAHLQTSIDSVLRQRYAPMEYIFVDGESTDGTLELIQTVPRDVRVLKGIGGGISRAMNAGLSVAQGDVIAHLHSDDYYLDSGVLDFVAQRFVETNARWLFGRIEDEIAGRMVPEGFVAPAYSYRRLLRGNFVPHQATFVRRDLFEAVGGFNEAYRYAMDYDMWLRLGRVAAPLQVDRPLAVFRRHEGSLSTRNRLEGLAEDFSIRLKYASRWTWAAHYARYIVRRTRIRRRILEAITDGT